MKRLAFVVAALLVFAWLVWRVIRWGLPWDAEIKSYDIDAQLRYDPELFADEPVTIQMAEALEREAHS